MIHGDSGMMDTDTHVWLHVPCKVHVWCCGILTILGGKEMHHLFHKLRSSNVIA